MASNKKKRLEVNGEAIKNNSISVTHPQKWEESSRGGEIPRREIKLERATSEWVFILFLTVAEF